MDYRSGDNYFDLRGNPGHVICQVETCFVPNLYDGESGDLTVFKYILKLGVFELMIIE